MVRFRRTLDEIIEKGEIGQETELSIEQRLTAFRAEHPDFRGLSFGTIAGYGAHGAIVHYEADEESNATLAPRSFLLLDSGAHYVSGTTDITRTIPLGPLTDEERKAYTLVLKGHIALARARFPERTQGWCSILPPAMPCGKKVWISDTAQDTALAATSACMKGRNRFAKTPMPPAPPPSWPA